MSTTQINRDGDKSIANIGLEDDDDFEEFPAEDSVGNDEEESLDIWEDDWDDDNVEDDFRDQLRAELQKQNIVPSF